MLTTEWILSAFGNNLGVAQKKYQQFVSEGKNQPTPWESLQNQVLLGNEAYVKEIFKKIDLKKDLSEIPGHNVEKKPNLYRGMKKSQRQEMKV